MPIPAIMAGISWGKLAWKAAPWILIALLAFALWGVWGWKKSAEAEAASARHNLQLALDANKEMELAAEKMRRQQEADRRLTAKVIEETRAASAATANLKKEQRHAPDAGDRLNPYWDDFADRLRALDAGTGGI